MLNRRQLLGAVPAVAISAPAAAIAATLAGLRVVRIHDKGVDLSDGRATAFVRMGEAFGAWTLVAILGEAVVLEDFSRYDGRMVFVAADGVRHDFGKTAESTAIDYGKGFLGATEAQVRASATDLLGQRILSRAGDPDYDAVAGVFPPIRKVWGDTYNFLGTPDTQDKIWFAYGGRSPNFDPAVYQQSIDQVRQGGRVLDGLVGGYLPCLRFVYPEDNGDWTEMLAFAPFRIINDNRRMQPVWYRVSRIEGGRLKWIRHVDSYLPYPPRQDDDPKRFYAELTDLKAAWDNILAPGMAIEVPDARIANQARHSLIRAMMGRSEGFPKYGAVDKNYGNYEHDGFPDTFTVETSAMIEWGLIARAGDYIDNYFGKFVRDDGAILYRGPETGQFGRMLTVVAQYIEAGGDAGIVLRHQSRIDAITDVLLSLRQKALELRKDDPAYGMISGWSEADAVLEADPQRYMQPYFSNSTEAVRGFRDLGRVWQRIGHDVATQARGRFLSAQAEALNRDLQAAIARSLLRVDGEVILPVIAGAKEPFHVVLQRDRSDPQWRAYRSNMEMLFSGVLTAEQDNMIVDYRGRHHDIVLGMPMAYGYNTGEMAGFLSYGHGYGLIRNDRIREALLMTFSSMAHQYTRGMWLAPETRRPLSDDWASAYCGPSQLVCPLITRWLLVFEDPQEDVLWLGRGVPEAWLADGKTVAVANAATRWGRVGYAVRSHRSRGRIEATLALPVEMTVRTHLRLRSGKPLKSVRLNGRAWMDFAGDTIHLPAGLGGDVRIAVRV